MFSDGEIEDVVIKPLNRFSDARGWLVEVYRSDELDPEHTPQMAYVTESMPGVVRGPHEHTDQTDCMGFMGPGDVELYLWDTRRDSPTHGTRFKLLVGQSSRRLVIIPPGVVHAFRNVGSQPAWVFNFPNRLYAGSGKRPAVDEIRHEESRDCPYVLD